MSQHNSINSNLRSGPFFISTRENPESPITPKICEWNLKENIKFFVFLKHYREIIEQSCTLRRWTAYKLMSKFVVTKNFTQCRNHYMKLKKQHGDIQSIEKYLIAQNRGFSELFGKYNSELEKFIQTWEKNEKQPTVCTLKDSTQKQQEEKTVSSLCKQPKADKHTLNNCSFVMSKCNSMPDFYLKLFYPQLIPPSDNHIFFYGGESDQFGQLC